MTCDPKVVYNYFRRKSMEEIKIENPQTEKPKSTALGKIGNLLFVLAIICAVACGLAFASIIIMPIIWIIGFFLIIITFGLIFKLIPGYWSKLAKFSNIMNDVGNFFLKVGPYVAGVGIALGVGAIVCLAFDKSKKHTGKIVATSIITILLIAALVLILVNR